MIGANTGVVHELSGDQQHRGQAGGSPRWIAWPLLAFLVSYFMVGIGMVTAETRELHRRDTAQALGIRPGECRQEPAFSLFLASYVLDTGSFVTLRFGIAVAFYALDQLLAGAGM